jgi:hypothetical protein
VRSRFRVGMWITFGTLVAACFSCVAGAFGYEWRKHSLAGVPWNHFAVRLAGQPVYVPKGGGPLAARPQVPMTEEQFRAWEENEAMGRSWARAAAVFGAAWMALLFYLKVARPTPTGPPPHPLQQTAGVIIRSW